MIPRQRGPERATLQIDAGHEPASGKWYFAIIGAKQKVMRRSKPIYEDQQEARAAARDWLTQTMLR